MRLRLVQPGAGEGATQTVLGKAFGFTELPIVHAPTSADLVEGSYTLRLGDSGEFQLTFPNTISPKGVWREFFDPADALCFLEIYRDDVLEFVGQVQRVEIDRGQVVVSGADAASLLRRAYEQDRTWTAAPREVIEAYTRVPLPIVADDFPGTALDAAWTASPGSGTIAVANGRVRMTDATSGVTMNITRDVAGVGDTWRASTHIPRYELTPTATHRASLYVLDSGAKWVELRASFGAPAQASLLVVDSSVPVAYTKTIQIPILTAPATLVLEGQGAFVRGFVNGRLVGYLPTTFIPTRMRLEVFTSAGAPLLTDIDWEMATFTTQASFLMRGSDKGDYVLPGDYPHGGLHGRYWNNADLTTANYYQFGLFAPNRPFAAEQLDPKIDTAAVGGLQIPPPGIPADHFSARWFGAIYLRLDQGDYAFKLLSLDDGARLWVGKTDWGTPLINAWTLAAGTKTAVLSAASLGAKAGWYPIVLEYFEKTGGAAITLQFTPPAGGYTDPGGTVITQLAERIVPSTSLSPLGCYDNRVQGQSHFDLAFGAAADFGYEIACEPMQLESGEFPGRLAPRLRVGRDTDVILEPEDTDGTDPILSPGVTLDGSDQILVLQGAGAGLPNGQGAQTTAEIADLASVTAALFALEGRLDAGEIAFPELLEARLNAELALRSSPWEEVRGVPRAQEGLADTWPLTGALSAMRWRPGDGVRVHVPDVGVDDQEPRRLLQVTRSFAAEGRTGTQVGFRQRPRSAVTSVKRLLRAALAPVRNDQGRVIALPSATINPDGAVTTVAGAFTTFASIGLASGDRIVRATLRIFVNSGNVPLSVEVNTVNQDAALNGPFTVKPVDLDLTPVAKPLSGTDQRLLVRLQNGGGAGSIISFNVFVEVLR